MLRMWHCSLLLLSLLWFGVPAVAQTSPPDAVNAPVMGSQATTAPAAEAPPAMAAEPQAFAAPSQTRNILVIGDGLAGGLGAGLTRMIESNDGYKLYNRFQENSGLARPELYDWVANAPNLIADKNITDVVVLIGSNDRQDMREGEQSYGFGTAEWQKAYSAQLLRLFNALKAAQVQIHWVALPPMLDPQYEADMQVIRNLQAQASAANGARYDDFKAAFSNPDGSYADHGPDDTGEVRKLRGKDGVTFLKQGNNRLGQLMLAALEQQAPVATSAPAAAATAAGPVAGAALVVPVFGQHLLDGSSVTFEPDTSQVVAVGATVAKIIATGPVVRNELVPGSNAEKLFTQGLVSPAPAGRFDDYSVAPAK